MDDTLNEISDLLQEKEISTEAATRLMLRTQSRIIHTQTAMLTQIKSVKSYNERYPSITWLYTHRRKTTIFVAFAIFAIFYSIFAPITITDIRQGLLTALSSIP